MEQNKTADDSLRPIAPRVSLLPIFGHVLVHGLASFFFLAVLISLVPKTEKVFKDFDVLLPGPTQIVLEWSWCAMDKWFLAPFLLLVDGGILYGLSSLSRPWSRLAGGYSLLLMLAAVVAMVYILVALVLPFVTFVEQLGPRVA